MVGRPILKNQALNVTSDVFAKSIWVSSCLAIVFTLPPLALLVGIYWNTGNLLAGAIVGFTVHFAILAISPKLSVVLSSVMDP
jgi:hypothetical protein